MAQGQMQNPAQGAGGGAAGGAKELGKQFLYGIIADMIGKGVGAIVAPGGPTVPSEPMQTTGSRYNITPEQVRETQRYVNEENFRRSVLNRAGANLPYLDADEILRQTVETNQILMEQAGARERALEQVRQQGAVQSALAQSMGQAVGTGLTSLGGVNQQFISSLYGRPPVDPLEAELGRAF